MCVHFTEHTTCMWSNWHLHRNKSHEYMCPRENIRENTQFSESLHFLMYHFADEIIESRNKISRIKWRRI